ncbi:MAG: hypothetical protein JSW51_04555, partial [Gemmatimonadota bacterium]
MSGSRAGPRLAALLLLVIHRRARTVIRADLDEEYYNDVVPRLGRRRARWWYWREAASLMKSYLWARFRGDVHRFRSHSSPDPERRESNTMSQPRAFIESGWQDVRYGVRSLRTRPLFTTVAVITLGLGIGAMTAMFSVVDGVLLQRLPYGDPAKLVSVWVTHPEWRGHPFLGEYWNKGPLSYSE